MLRYIAYYCYTPLDNKYPSGYRDDLITVYRISKRWSDSIGDHATARANEINSSNQHSRILIERSMKFTVIQNNGLYKY